MIPFFSPADSFPEFAERAEWLLEQARADLVGPGPWRLRGEGQPLENRAANDLGKHWWPRVLAELEAAPDGSSLIAEGVTASDLINGLVYNKPMLPFSRDPNVGYLYFSPVGLGWIVNSHWDLIEDDTKATLLEATFRYPDTQASLNMFTGEGTENHVLMGRTGGYLISQAVLRHADDPIAQPYLSEAQRRLESTGAYFWSMLEAHFEVGTGEYDSSTYYPYVIACWLAVFEHADDPEMKAIARAGLDWFAATVAVRTFEGVFGGYEQRGGSATASFQSTQDQFSWIWFGGTPPPELRGRGWSQMVYAALSEYRPPEVIVNLARRNLTPELQTWQLIESEPSYIIHGSDSVPSESKGIFYNHPAFTLGSVLARPIGGFTGGTSQDVLWKLTSYRPENRDAVVFIGERGRHPWRQLAQWENVLLVMTWHPENARALVRDAHDRIKDWARSYGEDFDLRFPEDTAHPNTVTTRDIETRSVRSTMRFPMESVQAVATQGRQREPIVFVAAGSAFVAIRSLDGELPEIREVNDVYQLDVTVSRGGFNGFAIEVVPAEDYPDLTSFMEAILAAGEDHEFDTRTGTARYRSLQGREVELTFQPEGTYKEPEYDWGFGWTTFGGQSIPAMPPARFPDWPEGRGHGRVPEISIDGRPLGLGDRWPIYASPVLWIEEGRMQVTDGRSTYQVDVHVGEVEFSETPGAFEPPRFSPF